MKSEVMQYRQQLEDPNAVQMEREKVAEQFGSFIQLFAKEGDNIACYSYPLRGISTEEARRMTTGILYPDRDPLQHRRYESSDGNLMFGSRSADTLPDGLQGVIRRYLAVPEQVVGVDNSNRIKELGASVHNEFMGALHGTRDENAQNSSGTEIFAFGYKVTPDGVMGRGVNGQEIRLSQLAMKGYDEHAKLLGSLEEELMTSGDGVWINIDGGPTVSLCCAKFFAEKLVGKVQEVSHNVLQKIKDTAALYVGSGSGPALALAEKDFTVNCDRCGSEKTDTHSCKKKN